jgi:FkbM family methyltransferase
MTIPRLKLPTGKQCIEHIELATRHDLRLARLLDLLEADRYIDDDGSTVLLQPSGITRQIGGLIHWLVVNSPPAVTLDMGSGSGIGASLIALAKTQSGAPLHYSFCPALETTTGEISGSLVKHLRLESSVSVRREFAHVGLQRLDESAGCGRVGLALIDGPCLFDQLVADHVVVDRFLAPDGLLLVCNADLPQIRALLSFLVTNRKYEVQRWAHEFVVVRQGTLFERPQNYFEPFEVPLEGYVKPIDGVVVETIAPDGRKFVFANEPSHQYHLRRVLHGREYPALFHSLFKAEVILDIGAHAGSAARYFSALYPTARIVCVEPTAESFDLLCRNTNHLPHVERHRIAFAATSGPVRIWRGISSSGQNSAIPNQENIDSHFDVEGIEPLSFCAQHKIDAISILKIDIEGMELSVLRNLEPMFNRIEVLYIEYHSEELRRQIEDLFRPSFTLFMSEATEANRGTVGFAQTMLLADLQASSSTPRYVFPKRDSNS